MSWTEEDEFRRYRTLCYELARDVLRYAIKEIHDIELESHEVVPMLQEVLFLAHEEITEELLEMEEELIDLGLTKEELEAESPDEDNDEEGDQHGP